MFYLQKVGHGYGVPFRNVGLRWQISESTKVVIYVYAQALTDSEIVTFQVFELQKVGQGHGVYCSLANIIIYKVVTCILRWLSPFQRY